MILNDLRNDLVHLRVGLSHEPFRQVFSSDASAQNDDTHLKTSGSDLSVSGLHSNCIRLF